MIFKPKCTCIFEGEIMEYNPLCIVHASSPKEKVIEATNKTLDQYAKTFKDLAEFDKGNTKDKGWEFQEEIDNLYLQIARLADKGNGTEVGYLLIQIKNSFRTLLASTLKRRERIEKIAQDIKKLERWTVNICPVVDEKAIAYNQGISDLLNKI